MNIAILSDIHSNIYALRAVIDDIKRLNINSVLISGDFVGYYFEVNQVVSAVLDFDVYACQGNHDRMFIDFLENGKDFNKLYNFSLLKDKVNKSSLVFLKSLKPIKKVDINGLRFLICHGSPWAQDQYVYPDTNLSEVGEYDKLNVDVIVQGNTHIPMNRKVGNVTIVNPGSVGQPREKKKGQLITSDINLNYADWAIINVETCVVSFKKSKYISTDLLLSCRMRCPENNFVAQVLNRSRV